MSREEQRRAVRELREGLIAQLEEEIEAPLITRAPEGNDTP